MKNYCTRLLGLAGLLAALPLAAVAQTFVIDGLPFGLRFEGSISHTSPDGNLVTPVEASVQPLTPPAVFSAPLPSGSGARALK